MICMHPLFWNFVSSSLCFFTTLTTCRVFRFVFHAHCFFFSSPFFDLFFSFSKRVCPLCWVWNTPPPPVCVPVSVLSLPVQCWSLSCGKQRRPFRLCAPTWLRQQVCRTFHFFSSPTPRTRSLLPLSVTPLISVPPRETGPGPALLPFVTLTLLLDFSESEIPSQERKNLKSSPEVQVRSRLASTPNN